MPFDLDRIIDRAGYLATQQCIQPYAQQRRVSSAPATTSAAAAAGTARTAGARKSSLGSLVSPWSTSSGGSSNTNGSSRRRSPSLYHHRPRPLAQQGYSPVDLFFTAPVGIPLRRGGIPGRPAREDSSSSLDQFVTAPVGDFNNTGPAPAAAAAHLVVPPRQKRGNGSRPGSSDTDDDEWTFATASGGSGGTGTFSGLDTTVDLTPSPPPSSARTGKAARHTVAPRHLRQQPQPADQDPGPGHDRVSAVTLQVRDLRRTKRFYERVFGAACLSSLDDYEEDGTSARLRLNGGGLVVTLRESHPDARRGDGSGAGCRGLLLTVPVDDAGEVCRRLQSLPEEEAEEVEGWRTAEPVNGPGGARVVTFSDPAGHCWQVVQDPEEP